jgi:hypothetical protein
MSVKTAFDVPVETGLEASDSSWVDRAGICVSAACAVHCLAMPILLAVIPAMSSILVIGHGIEVGLAGAAVILAVACLCWGFRIHRKKRLILSFSAAAIFILSGQLWAEGWLETALVVCGGLGLVGSHLLNRALCRSCSTCCSHEH